MLPTKHLRKSALVLALSVSLFACGGSDNNDDDSTAPITVTEVVDVANGSSIDTSDLEATVEAGTKVFVTDDAGVETEVAAADIGEVEVTVSVVTDSTDGLADAADIQDAIDAAEAIAAADTTGSTIVDSAVSVSATVVVAGVKQTVTTFDPPVKVLAKFSEAKVRAGCSSYTVRNKAGNEVPGAQVVANGIEFFASNPGQFTVTAVGCPTGGAGGTN
jgi:hypothetical protein